MEKSKQIEIYKELDEKIMELANFKGHDYATEDVLNNFKSVSAAAKALNLDVQKPVNYALFMVLLKIARIVNLTNGNKYPRHESVDDSFVDGINYLKLAYCNFRDVPLDLDW
ncbi:MAG: hypothetical protein ACK55Z_04020 [bacterium]